MRRTSNKIRFPKAISEDKQKQYFNEKVLNPSVIKIFKNNIFEDIKKLPYLTDVGNDLSWIESPYIHPLDSIVSIIKPETQDQKAVQNASEHAFVDVLFKSNIFTQLSKYVPSIKLDNCIFENVAFGEYTNSLPYTLPNDICISTATKSFLKFRLNNPEYISRLLGGYIKGDYFYTDQSLNNIKYPDPSHNGIRLGKMIEPSYMSDARIKKLKSNNISITNSIEPTIFTAIENPEIDNNIEFNIFNQIQSILPDTLLESILNMYNYNDMYATWCTVNNSLVKQKSTMVDFYNTLAQDINNYITAQNRANVGIGIPHYDTSMWVFSWDYTITLRTLKARFTPQPQQGNKHIILQSIIASDINGGKQTDIQIVTKDTSFINVGTGFPSQFIPYNLIDLIKPYTGERPADFQARILPHIYMTHYFPDFCLYKDDFRLSTHTTFSPPVISYWAKTRPGEIRLLSPQYVCGLLKNAYAISCGDETYKNIVNSLGPRIKYATTDSNHLSMGIIKPITGTPGVASKFIDNCNAITMKYDILVTGEIIKPGLNNASISLYLNELIAFCRWSLDNTGTFEKFVWNTIGNVQNNPFGPLLDIVDNSMFKIISPENLEYLTKYSIIQSNTKSLEIMYPSTIGQNGQLDTIFAFDNLEKTLRTTTPEKLKTHDMFWDGIESSEWKSMNHVIKSIISDMCIVMGLYDRKINGQEITYCGILDQIPSDVKVTRICFFPLMHGQITKYNFMISLKTAIIGQGVKTDMELRHSLNSLKIQSNKKSLDMTGAAFEKFMQLVRDSTHPSQVLIAYCIAQHEHPNINNDTFKFNDYMYFVQSLWIILSKLQFRISFADVSKNNSGVLKVQPPIHISIIKNLIIRDLNNDTKLAYPLIEKSMGLINFLADVAAATKDKTLIDYIDTTGGSNSSSSEDEYSIIILPDMNTKLHQNSKFNVDIIDFQGAANVREYIKAEPLRHEFENYYNFIDSSDINPINIKDKIKDLSENIPLSIHSQILLSEQTLKGDIVSTIDKQYNEIKKYIDSSGGAYVDFIINNNSNNFDTTVDIINEAEADAIMSAIDVSLGHRSLLNRWQRKYTLNPFNPMDSNTTKYLNNGIHGLTFMKQFITRLSNFEKFTGVPVSDDVKSTMINGFKSIFEVNRELYKFTVCLDFMEKLTTMLKALGHSIDDPEFGLDTFDATFQKLKPRVGSLLADFDSKIKGPLNRIITENNITLNSDYNPID